MISDIIRQTQLQISRAQESCDEITGWVSLDQSIYNDFQKIKTIDSFILRFTKIQDIMGTRLFRAYLEEQGEYDRSMSLLDILDKLEQLVILENSESWIDYRKLRNRLAHEYPDNQK